MEIDLYRYIDYILIDNIILYKQLLHNSFHDEMSVWRNWQRLVFLIRKKKNINYVFIFGNNPSVATIKLSQ